MMTQFCILIKTTLKFIPRVPFGNKSALVQVMAWAITWTNGDPTHTNVHKTSYRQISQSLKAVNWVLL